MKRMRQQLLVPASWLNRHAAWPAPGATVSELLCAPLDLACHWDVERAKQYGERCEPGYAALSPSAAQSSANVPASAREPWAMPKDGTQWRPNLGGVAAAADSSRCVHVPAITPEAGSSRHPDGGSIAFSPCKRRLGG